MKILAFSDTHGDIKKIRELAEKSEKENVDLVLMCGDFTYFDELPPYLIKPFKDRGKKVLFIPGNHESRHTSEFLSRFYNITNLDGAYAIYGNVALIGCGGGNMPPNIVSDDEIIYKIRNANKKVAGFKKKIIVTHVHPSSAKIDRLLPGSGSKGLKKIIEEIQPDIVICGHIHEASGTEDVIGKTKVINVAKTSKIIEI